MLKSTYAVLLSVFVVAMSGCEPAGAPGSIEPSTDTIKGAWEIESVTSLGRTIPAKMKSPANEQGYPESFEKIQYQISATQIRVITSDEVSILFQSEDDFELASHKLLPKKTANSSISAFDIVRLSTDQMSIRPLEEHQPKDLVFNLIRIRDVELATNRMKAIPQKLTYQIKSPSIDESLNINDIFSTTPGAEIKNAISCRYKKDSSPQFTTSNFIYQISSGGVYTSDGNDPHLEIQFDVPFNFSVQSESFKLNLSTHTKAVLNVIHKKNANLSESQLAEFHLGATSKCEANVNRTKRFLTIKLSCENLEVSPMNKPHLDLAKGQITIEENCVLKF